MKIVIKNETPSLAQNEHFEDMLKKMELVFQDVKKQVSSIQDNIDIDLDNVKKTFSNCQSPI
jgi:hypothetical protein